MKRRARIIQNSINENNSDRTRTNRPDLSKNNWPDYSQDILVRERAYRDFLIGLKAQLRQAISDRNADIKLLKELSSKNGVSLAWYLFRVAVPVLDDDCKESTTKL